MCICYKVLCYICVNTNVFSQLKQKFHVSVRDNKKFPPFSKLMPMISVTWFTLYIGAVKSYVIDYFCVKTPRSVLPVVSYYLFVIYLWNFVLESPIHALFGLLAESIVPTNRIVQ